MIPSFLKTRWSKLRHPLFAGSAAIALILILVPSQVYALSSAEALNTFGQFMGYILLNLASFFTWLGGMILEYSIKKYILEIGNVLSNQQALGIMITKLWGLIRDICNLLFIFGFVWVGLRTIIDADDSGAKRTLASLLIAALLINFSLYITKVVIDVSNYTAVEVYNAVFTGPDDASLSASFAKSLGIYSFYERIPSGDQLAGLTVGGAFGFYLMAAVLLVVAGFVFGAGGILIVVRFAVLVFIMVFSPLLFAATVFPATSDIASKLWKYLLNYSLFAPAYLILLLISIQIISALMKGINPSGEGLAKGIVQADSFSVIIGFLAGIMFLILSLKVAQQFGIAGADKAMAVGKNMRNRVQGFAGRNTVGRASYALLKKYEKDDAKIGEMKGVRGAVLRGIRGTLNVTGADKGIRKGLEAGKKATFGSDDSYYSNKEWNKELEGKRAGILKLEEFKKAVEEGIAANATPDQKIKMERAVADASVKYLEELDQKVRERIADKLSQGQIDGLEKSTELSDIDRSNIGKARSASIAEIYKVEKDKLTKASVEHLTALGHNYLKEEEHAVRLTSSQVDDLKKKLTSTEFAEVSKAREEALKKLSSGVGIMTTQRDPNTGQAMAVNLDKSFILKQKDGEIAKMPADALKSLATELKIGVLAKITQDGTLNNADQRDIRTRIGAALVRNPNDPHLNDIHDFLTDTPLGKQFGQ